MPTQIPFDVQLSQHEWLEMCRAAHDEPTPTEAAEHLAALLNAHNTLQAENDK